MKPKTAHRFSTLAAIYMVVLGTATAAAQYWDGSVSSANGTSDNDSAAPMNWLNGGNWDDGSTSAPRSFWTFQDTAIFGGSFSGTQTVTLSSPLWLGNGNVIGGVGSSYRISLAGTVLNQFGAPSGTITINEGSTLSADVATLNANGHNLGALTLNGATLTSINGPAGPANDNNFGNWGVRGVTVGGNSLSTISSSTLYIVSGSFNVADAVSGSGTDLLVSSKIISGSLTKTGAGTMELTGANTNTGTTTVSGGTLLLTQNFLAFNTSAINGAVNVESGATLTMNNNPTGWGGGLTALNVNGGTVNGNGGLGAFAVTYNLTGGTITGTARVDLGQRGATVGSINSLASGTTSVISNSQGIMFRRDSGQTNFTINTAAGTTPSGVDLQINGVISQNAGASTLVKDGSGTLLMKGNNTYTGATAINGGTLVITGASQATSAITFGGGKLGLDIASPVAAAGATINFTGQQVLVSGTPTLPSYTLLTASSITGTPTLAAPAPAGYGLKVESNSLKLVKLGYASWATLNGAGPNLNDDHDNDGVNNGIEYFLGGPNGPTTGFTTLPGVTNTLGTLSITWIKGAGYIGAYTTDFVVETSTTLSGPWTVEASPGDVSDSPASVTYTFPGGPAYSGKRFARLKVTGP